MSNYRAKESDIARNYFKYFSIIIKNYFYLYI